MTDSAATNRDARRPGAAPPAPAEPQAACQVCGATRRPGDSIVCRVCGEPVLAWGWAP